MSYYRKINKIVFCICVVLMMRPYFTDIIFNFPLLNTDSTIIVNAKEKNKSKEISKSLRPIQNERPAKPGSMTKIIKKFDDAIPIYDRKDKSLKNTIAIIPSEYMQAKYSQGKIMNLPENSITVEDISINFVPLENNSGAHEDFDKVNDVLAIDGVPQVGQNGIRTFFGHYYDIPNTGAFAPLASRNLLEPGHEVIVTDAKGISTGYRITNIVPIINDLQYQYFYNEDSVPYLAYYGNGDDMIALMTCRWDKAIGQMDFSVAYRIW